MLRQTDVFPRPQKARRGENGGGRKYGKKLVVEKTPWFKKPITTSQIPV